MKLTRADMPKLVEQALGRLGGCDRIPMIAKAIWDEHEADLRSSGELFYTWQYDMRWASQHLRDCNRLVKGDPKSGYWRLIGVAK